MLASPAIFGLLSQRESEGLQSLRIARRTAGLSRPGESFGETEDLSDLQVRIPLRERFTSYWRGGVVDESYQNQRQQSRHDLGNAYNAEIEMIQNPSDQRMAMQSTGPVCCNSFKNIMRQSAAANQALCLGWLRPWAPPKKPLPAPTWTPPWTPL